MGYGFEYVKPKGEKLTCTSHSKASIILKKAKEAFKKTNIVMKYKGEETKLSKLKIKKDKKEVKLNCIYIPEKIMKKYGCNSSVSIYSELTRELPEKRSNLHSYYAYTKDYKKIIIESWEVMNFHFYRSFGSACFSPDKSKLIFTYNNAAGPNKPTVVDIKDLATIIILNKSD
ncbi:MAG: hypothetical protein GY714_32940 [Desulfobacterales bacterium]|nr:hypothetical protein [Desulfobacterales bacterium]